MGALPLHGFSQLLNISNILCHFEFHAISRKSQQPFRPNPNGAGASVFCKATAMINNIYLRQVETNRLTKLTVQLTRTDCNKKTLRTLS